MGTAVSKRKNLRNDAISSVAAKVRAARAFGDYLSHTQPENRNGAADHLLSDTFIGQDSESPDGSRVSNNNNLPQPGRFVRPIAKHNQSQPHAQVPPHQPSTLQTSALSGPSKRRLSVEQRSLSSEDPPVLRGPEGSVATKPARVYTITREGGMILGGRGSEESLELKVLRGSREQQLQPQQQQTPTSTSPLSSSSSSAGQHHHQASSYTGQTPPAAANPRGSHHRSGSGHHRTGHHHASHHQHHQQHQDGLAQSQPLQSSGSAHNIQDWGARKGGGSRDDCAVDCVACIRAPCQSQRSLDLDSSPRDGEKPRKKLERMYSEDRTSTTDDKEDNANGWFPKENVFSFQTASTTMQAISAFRGIADRKRRKRVQESATMMERNFRKQLRMVGSRRMKTQTFAERRAKSFSRSWSDPTPIKPDSLHGSRDSGDLQTSSGTLDEGSCEEDTDWEEERETERVACEGEDFIPPKIMLISSKVPKAEYVPNIIRRDDPSVIPILYDHEHATFDDIVEEVEKKLTAYRKGCRIWNMLIFCQGGPGHLYLLKNKVATFAKVEKEEDMILFWKKLSRLMSKLNPEPNLIHIMGCYVLGSANGEKLTQNLKKLMRPYSVEFKSPLELSAQGKEMIEMYFDFRLFRLWKSRQHSKMLDYDDLL